MRQPVKTGLGGDTFGAPGIPAADINTGLPSHLTNFVDHGDPVGNYSANPDRVGNPPMGDDIVRYRRPTYVGQASDAASLAAAVGFTARRTSPPPQRRAS